MERLFRVPSYYLTFQCKGPACARQCCTGWDVSVSLEEYFRLLALPLEPPLRGAMDRSLHLADDRSEEHYAQLSKNYEGECPLHRPDGWCALQAAHGEEVLPSICRYYPRSPHLFGETATAAAAASCEAVAERLLSGEPVTVQTVPLDFAMPLPAVAAPPDFAARQDQLLDTLRDRSLPLADRLRAAGESLRAPMTPGRPRDPLRAAALLADWFATHSASAATDCADAERYLGFGTSPADEAPDSVLEDAAARLSRAEERFRAVFADDQLEALLVNRVLREGFPTPAPDFPPEESAVALAALYTFLRVAVPGHLAALFPEGAEPDPGALHTALVSTVSELFRLIDHTAFSHNALILLHRAGLDSLPQVLL